MSDRVAIIGGSTVGRDHFPFAVGDGTGGANTIRPYTLDLANMAKYFYTVKKWRFFMEFDYNDTVSGVTTSGHATLQFDLIPKVRTGPNEYALESWTHEDQVVQPRSGVRCVFTLKWDGTVEAGIDEGDEIPFDTLNGIGSASYDNGSGESLLLGELFFDLYDTKYNDGFLPFVALRYDAISSTSLFATDGSASGSTSGGVLVLDHLGAAFGTAAIVGQFGSGDGTFIFTNGYRVSLDPQEFWPFSGDGSGSQYQAITQNNDYVPQTLNVLTDSAPWVAV